MSDDEIILADEDEMLNAEGNCFIVAADTLGEHMQDDNEWFIVHALVQHPDTKKYHWHAWNEYEANLKVPYTNQEGAIEIMPVTVTTVIDRSNGREVDMPAALYYAIGRITAARRYNAQEAGEAMFVQQHYGPWHEEFFDE